MAKLKTGPRTKRKGGGIPAKAAQVDGLVAQLASANAVLVTNYRGLTVHQLQELRRRLRPKGVEYHVVKNSLFARAAERSGKAGLATLLAGPTAVALGPLDEVDLARGVVEETRTLRALRILGAFVAGRALSGEAVAELAKLPPRAQLQAMIVGTLQSPLGTLVSVLVGAHGQLIRVLMAKGSH